MNRHGIEPEQVAFVMINGSSLVVLVCRKMPMNDRGWMLSVCLVHVLRRDDGRKRHTRHDDQSEADTLPGTHQAWIIAVAQTGRQWQRLCPRFHQRHTSAQRTKRPHTWRTRLYPDVARPAARPKVKTVIALPNDDPPLIPAVRRQVVIVESAGADRVEISGFLGLPGHDESDLIDLDAVRVFRVRIRLDVMIGMRRVVVRELYARAR